MNNKSKFVALVAALLVAVSATACGGSDAASSVASSETSSPASSAVSSESSSEVSSEASSEAPSEAPSEASSEASSDDVAEVELTPEQQTYVDEVTALQTKLTDVQTKMSTLTPDDVDGLKAAVGEAKAILTDLGNVSAPEKLKPAQEKLKSGYTTMNEYFDYVIELAEMEGTPDAAQAAEVQTKVTELMTKAVADLQEGDTMLKAALAE